MIDLCKTFSVLQFLDMLLLVSFQFLNVLEVVFDVFRPIYLDVTFGPSSLFIKMVERNEDPEYYSARHSGTQFDI